MIIQFLLVPAVVLAVLLSLRSRASLRGQARRKLLAALTVLTGVIAVLAPGVLQRLADWVGVDRGSDLLLYALAVVIIYLVGSVSVRFREQESRLVRLAREVALTETEGRLRAHPVQTVTSTPTGRAESIGRLDARTSSLSRAS
jgi:small membrane protein